MYSNMKQRVDKCKEQLAIKRQVLSEIQLMEKRSEYDKKAYSKGRNPNLSVVSVVLKQPKQVACKVKPKSKGSILRYGVTAFGALEAKL